MSLSVGGSLGSGLVHYPGEQQASKICVTSLRSFSSAQGRIHHRLEQREEVLSFSVLDANFVSSVSTPFIQGSDGPDCTSLASPFVVPTASVSGQSSHRFPIPCLTQGVGDQIYSFSTNLNLHLHAWFF